ncbi:polysaccharide deacetylase family protein [Notoacmeibacter marinus]|uniref:polysaccharide deacetylase family protein n=1 Tax=Notoacmeibacter marinus TaxID=1876515 RepID=UPI000DF40B60|nr:polysaccharide deacetylase family protein [Notoacmeibacter marinus]
MMKQSARHFAIRAALEAIAATNPRAIVRRMAAHSVIFTLHHVRPASDEAFAPNAGLSVQPDFLDEAIEECTACNFTPIRLSDLPARLAAEPHGRFVAFTLDDGCRDNRDHAAPVFRRHGVPYTLFVTKGFAQRTQTMWWETAEAAIRQVERWVLDGEAMDCSTLADKTAAFRRTAALVDGSEDETRAVAAVEAAAQAAGVDGKEIVKREAMDEAELTTLSKDDPFAEFGVHTLTHSALAKLSGDAMRREIDQSIDWITELTGKRPVSVAYPYGHPWACGSREAAAADEAGLSVGVTTQPGKIVVAPAAPLLLPRVSLNGLYQEPRFVRAFLSGRLLKTA